jgi:hypothetical protein
MPKEEKNSQKKSGTRNAPRVTVQDFMHGVTNEVAREYSWIQKWATLDPGTAGDQGEETWATVLRDWLPPTYQILTKGRIIDDTGNASPQVDVIVLKPFYPRRLSRIKLYLAGGVAAAFECKTTLKRQHIEKAIKNAVQTKRLLTRQGTPYREIQSPIIYGLLAHSYNWKAVKKGHPYGRIDDCLWRYDSEHVAHPREMLDILCVADMLTWHSSKWPFLGPPYIATNQGLSATLGPEGAVMTGYHRIGPKPGEQFPFTAIGEFIPFLLMKLAREDPGLRDFALYFESLFAAGVGGGQMRKWDPVDVYSVPVLEAIRHGKLNASSGWDEWSMAVR